MLIPLVALALAGCDEAQAPTPSDAVEAGLPAEATVPAYPAESGVTAPAPSLAQPSTRAMSSPVAGNSGADDECGAGKLADLIGKSATPAVRAHIAATAGAGRVRIYTIGDALTMDYSPQRLNVELDEGGRITKLSCG
ncbi:MAG TPA: I78 family peptidase inhibitor [Novosphingobium sp.]|nr:I78 family peptidase inhibitor [Novosphingobium sp.]